MGMFNSIKIEAPLTCCNKPSKGWQSKRLEVHVGGTTVHVQSTCATLYSLEGIVAGEMHDWCDDCKKMTRYIIEEGECREAP